MEIVTCYTKLLTSLGLHVDSETGVISIIRPDMMTPIMIDGKTLVMPTQKNLMSGVDYLQKHMMFHPVSQSLIRKESKVMKKLRAMINIRLYEIITVLLETNLTACATKFDGCNATPEQMKMMAKLAAAGNVNEKTLNALSSILDVIDPLEGHRFVNIYLQKNGKLADQTYSVVSKASFPIYDDATADKPKLFGVSVGSKGNMKVIRELFDYILPNSNVADTYSRGSVDLTAPNFHALMLTFGAIAESLNYALHNSANLIPNHEVLMMDLSWMEGLDKLSQYRAAVPSQPGNEGDPLDDSGSNAPPTPLHADDINAGIPQMGMPIGNAFTAPKLGMPLGNAQPAMMAPTAEAPKKALLGSALTQAFVNTAKSQNESFQAPVGGLPINQTRAVNDNTLHNIELQRKLDQEAMDLATKRMQGAANGMMNGMTPNVMMPQMNGMGMGMNGMPGMNNPLYTNLMQMLQMQYPQMVTYIMQNPQLNMCLAQFPQITQLVIQNPAILQNPANIFMMAQNLQMQSGGGVSAAQALAQGTSIGRLRGDQQKAKQMQEKQLEEQAKLMYMMQNGMMPQMNTNMMMPGMGMGMGNATLTPEQLKFMQMQMNATGMNGMGMNGMTTSFNNSTPTAQSTPFSTTM